MLTLRWCWYAARLALYLMTGLLRFAAKPGSRIIVPLLILLSAYFFHGELEAVLTGRAAAIEPGYMPESWLLDVTIGIGALIACAAYGLASRIVGLVLGAFPVGMRPLPPQRRLKPTKTVVKSVPVRIVVPALPRA